MTVSTAVTYVTVVREPAPEVSQPGVDSHEGMTIVRAKGTRLARRGFLGRFTNYVTYFLAAAWATLRLPRADIVVALTDPPMIGLVAWATSKRMGAAIRVPVSGYLSGSGEPPRGFSQRDD